MALRLPPVKVNAAIRVVTPATFARRERIDDGVKNLRALGFEPRFAVHALERGPLFFAGTAEQRIADLHEEAHSSDWNLRHGDGVAGGMLQARGIALRARMRRRIRR
jgi:muramoyltetrapeptide carboxypeptidase LdcA involved in peptidoglycan recycling